MGFQWNLILCRATKASKNEYLTGQNRRSTRGVAVVMVMFMILLVLGFTAATGLLTKQNFANAQGRERKLKAIYAIKAGSAFAIKQLSSDLTWNPSQTTPEKRFLDPQERIGFKVWLDGINRDSDTPLAASSGTFLKRGQAALKIVALIEGQELDSGFAGAEQTILLEKPKVVFDYSIFHTDKHWGPGQSGNPSSPTFYSSYKSISLLPVAPNKSNFPPPMGNQYADVRCLSSIVGLGDRVRLYGTLYTRSDVELVGMGGTAYLKEQKSNDEAVVPWYFTIPSGIDEDNLPTNLHIDSDQTLEPGFYGDFMVGDGVTLTLKRGGEYWFYGSTSMTSGMKKNAKIKLEGPEDENCIVYIHDFRTLENCSINMPDDPSEPPRPENLQIYITAISACSTPEVEIGKGTQAAFVSANDIGKYYINDNVTFYGALRGIVGLIGENNFFYYDQSLAGKELKGNTQWVLVSQGQN